MGCGQSTAAPVDSQQTQATVASPPPTTTTPASVAESVASSSSIETSHPTKATEGEGNEKASQPESAQQPIETSAASETSTFAPPLQPPRPANIEQDLKEAAALEHQLRNTMASAIPVESTDAPPAWKSFTEEQLAAIESARAAVRANGPLVMDPKGTYGLICRACSKPNSTNVTFCTGCSFPSTPEDIQRLPDNIFLLLVQGQDIGAKVCFRDDSTVCFNDKFPVSENHLDVIPTEVYADVTVLTKEHVPMLERLYEVGRAELVSRNLPWLPHDEPIDNLITAGYNFPVSVKHLHLHMVLPPFKHEKVFQYPRWHSHTKVLRDLNEFGRVQLYCDHPNDAEGEAEYQRAMKNSERLKKLHAEWEANNAATSSTEIATSATTMAESTEESTAPAHATTQ